MSIATAPPTLVESLKDARDRAERQAVLNALSLADGNISRAARTLKISRPKLYDLIRYHDIPSKLTRSSEGP